MAGGVGFRRYSPGFAQARRRCEGRSRRLPRLPKPPVKPTILERMLSHCYAAETWPPPKPAMTAQCAQHVERSRVYPSTLNWPRLFFPVEAGLILRGGFIRTPKLSGPSAAACSVRPTIQPPFMEISAVRAILISMAQR
jgi:hypothetical protein